MISLQGLMQIENEKAREWHMNKAVARYSILNDSKQLFASKYMLYLPTEKELEEEVKRERWRLEEKKTMGSTDETDGH